MRTTRISEWFPPPESPILGRDEVHVWRTYLVEAASQVERWQQTLTPEELIRAERYRFSEDRERFVIARGGLRAILGQYLSIDPDRLRFRSGPHGKPELVKETGGGALHFNLSHSGEFALYAVAHNRRVGIDVERLRANFEVQQLAARFFSPQEVAAFRELPATKQREAFFNCWTRKEAYIKATGRGLSLPLDQFDVSFAPGEPAALLNTRGASQEASRWSLQALKPGPGYVAALAVEGRGWQLKCWQWPGPSESLRRCEQVR